MTERVDSGLLLDGICVCGASGTTRDRIGLFWCEDCIHRRTLLAWGASHNWPALESVMEADAAYAAETPMWKVRIAEGQWFWVNAATLGKDEYIYGLLAVVDAYERQHAA